MQKSPPIVQPLSLVAAAALAACTSTQPVRPAPPPLPPAACQPTDRACLCPKGSFSSTSAEFECLKGSPPAAEAGLTQLHRGPAKLRAQIQVVERELYPVLKYVAALPAESRPKDCLKFDQSYLAADVFGAREMFYLVLCVEALAPRPVPDGTMIRVGGNFYQAEQTLGELKKSVLSSGPCAFSNASWDSESWWVQRTALIDGYSACYQGLAPVPATGTCLHAQSRAARLCELSAAQCAQDLSDADCQNSSATCAASKQSASHCPGSGQRSL